MSITVSELRAIIVADDTQYQQRMAAVLATSQRAQMQAQQMSSSFDSLGPSLLRAGAAMTAVGAAFGFLIKSGSDLQTALVHVAGNTSMSAAEFDNLQKSVVRLGLTTPVAMEDIGKAYMQARNFGFAFAEANVVVEAGLKSAVATGASAEQTVRALAIAMHQFNIPASEAAKTMDVLHLAAARGGQTLEQFTAVTGRVFSVAKAMGIGLVDVSAALSALTSSGLSAAQSATLLQGAIVKIANPAKGAKDEIARLSKATGIDLVHDFSQAGLASKGLQGVLDDISKAVGSNTAEILKLVPAMRGGIGVILLTTTAAADYKARLAELADVMAGKLKPTQQDFERVMGTVGAQARILGNSFQALGFELVTALGPSLTNGLNTLNSILPQVVLFIGQLPPVILAAAAAFVTTIGVVGSVSVALGALALLLGGPLTIAIVGVGVALGALAAVVALNFGRISAIVTGSTGTIKVNFIEIAGKAGAVVDAFQVLAISAVVVFDAIVSSAVIMARGVVASFSALQGAAKVALAIASGDIVGFGVALAELTVTAERNFAGVADGLKGMAGRIKQDLADISAHASGKFATEFALAASNAGRSFAKASAEQHQSIEDAGLKLVNAYIGGVLKGKGISAAAWHAMSDEGRAQFTATAQAWISQATNTADEIGNVAKKSGKKASDEMQKLLTAQLGSVNDWLKSIGSKIEISQSVWDKLLSPDTKTTLLHAQSAFHAIQDVIQKGQAELLAVQVKGMADHRQVIDVAVDDYRRWGAAIDAVGVKYGVLIRVIGGLKPPMTAHIADLHVVSDSEKQVESATTAMLNAIGFAEPWARAATAIKLHNDALAQLKNKYDDAARRIPESWNIVIKAIAGNQITTGLLKTTEAFVGFEQVVANLPGKFGDALRNTANDFQRWFATINGILHTLHQVFAGIPDGLAAAFKSVIGLFKNTTASVTSTITAASSATTAATTAMSTATAAGAASASAAWTGLGASATAASAQIEGAAHKAGDAVDQMNKKTNSSVGTLANSLIGKIGLIAGAIGGLAMVLGVQGMSHTQGVLQGALGGLMAGASIGAFFGPTGAAIGAVIGGIGGAIAGWFGSGQTAEQKAQQALAMQNAKISVQQAAQQVINSALEGFNNALIFLEHLDEFTAPRKAKFKEFFKAFSQLMDYFLELAKAWSTTSLALAKAAAEAIGPIAQAISALPAAFNAISGHFGVAESSFDTFFRDFDTLMNRFFARMDTWTNQQVKRAMKTANRLSPIVDLISPLVQGFKDLGTLTAPSDSVFDIIDSALNTLVTRMTVLADKWEKSLLKAVANFAEKVSPAIDLWKNAVDALKSMVDVPTPKPSDFNALFEGIEQAINGMLALASRLSTDGLSKAEAIAVSSLAIFTAIKAAVDALAGLRAYTNIPSETFAALVDDFGQAIQMMLDLNVLSVRFIGIATLFEQNIQTGADHLKNAVAIFTAAIKNLGFGLAAFGVTVTVPEPIGATNLGGGGFAPSSVASGGGGFAPSSASGGGGVTQNISVTIDPSGFRDIAHMYQWFKAEGQPVVQAWLGLPARLQQG
jgi:TP901 family phage tail tape measure protein